MLIQNMIVLLHKSLFLMINIEVYRQKSSFLDQNLVKVIFLNKEKERKPSDAFTCNGWYAKLNEEEYFIPSPSM